MAEYITRTYNNSTPGDDVIVGTSDSDLIDAGEGNDTISGLGGDDYLFGWSGNDVINGGDGDDWIFGEGGTDILTGGAGNDIFGEFDQWHNGDTITDFSVGDVILIRDADIASFSFSLQGDVLTFTGAQTSIFTGGTMTLTGVAGAVLTASAHPEGGVQIIMAAPPPPTSDSRNDFNGDGRSDILWRHNNGAVTNWLGQGNGGFAGNLANSYNMVDNSWQIEGAGDFNGDGRDDILWRRSNGDVTNWLGQPNGGFLGNLANSYNAVASSWHITGVGDFNGDGKDDILWRHDNGDVTNWLGQTNGSFVGNLASSYNAVANSWQVAGVGDFNGDGKDDILWRHDNGDVTNWLGQANGSFAGNLANSYNAVANSWHAAGIGDFNGDGKDDILWRHDNGDVTNWLGLTNGSFQGNYASSYNTISNSWHIDQVGDFNGDGRDDILWRHDNGDVTNWLGQTNGSFVGNLANSYTPIATGWHVQPDSMV